jgi:hypothetical protein
MMTDLSVYEVVWPRGKRVTPSVPLAKRLNTLEGKTICELWDWVFRGDEVFEIIEKELRKRYSGVKFVSYKEFGSIDTANEAKVLSALPDYLKKQGCHAVISGVVCLGSCTHTVLRACVAAEKESVPSASLISDGYILQSRLIVAGLGMSNIPFVDYPGQVNNVTPEQLQGKVTEVMVDQIIKGLTVQPNDDLVSSEPGLRDIVFEGAFEDVNQFYYDQEWSDGLPVVPPTVEKVEDFLKFTSRSADEVIGRLLPDNREATIWNVAVNGVMSGCRPEYMPVLIAVIEAMADPRFGQEHLGHTPGSETLIIVNGPIIKELGFNYEQGALRDGFQANTAIGRFWRLYLRNVAGFLPHKTDKATFGGTWRVVLAENEEAAARIGWETLGVEQGFSGRDNVVTISSCTETNQALQIGSSTAEELLDKLVLRIIDNKLYSWLVYRGTSTKPVIIMSPCVAEVIARDGYSKPDVKKYIYEHAKIKVNQLSRFDCGKLQDSIEQGIIPKPFSESKDPDRLIPLVFSPEDFMIIVSGDPVRDHCYIGAQNGFIGYPVSKKIELPMNWCDLMKGRSN